MTDLSKQIDLISSRFTEQLETLESEYQRWNNYKNDYDSLENQLKSLPDETKYGAMIPLGKLAFMPGSIIHTNEILVLLGDQYYAERSAKQAIEIVGRRREVVVENLRLVEAQLNSFKAKSDSLSEGLLSSSATQFNEEGLPIMEIREELPPIDKEQEAKKNIIVEPKKQDANELPESVLRARQMMKEADEKIKEKSENDDDNKALFDLLRQLEEEEEEEEEVQEIVTKPTIVEHKRRVEEEDDDDDDFDDFSDDDEDDDRYDREISLNMFERFADDEEYPLDGVVDQEDFTTYDEDLPPQISTVDDEKSTPKVITKKKEKAPIQQDIVEAPKKVSKFKLSLQQKNDDDEDEEKSTPKVITKKKHSSAIKSVVKEVAEPTLETPKKVSKFKLAQQQKKAEEESNTEIQPTETPKKVSKFKLAQQQKKAEEEKEEAPKKVSKFKLAQQQKKMDEVSKKPKRTVTFSEETDVRDHDKLSAPNVVSQTASYAQPVKSEVKEETIKIRSPADIFRTIKATQANLEDGYPSLEDNDDTNNTFDLNELIKAARNTPEPFYRPSDGGEALIPMVNSSVEDKPNGIIVAKKSKLDNKIMKGAVMEREIEPVDLDQVEEEMDLREITSSYHQKRQNMIATTGGFSFTPKPEFEVVEEELPLPKKNKEEEEKEEVVPPKKMSRFKAARLGIKLDNDEYGYA